MKKSVCTSGPYMSPCVCLHMRVCVPAGQMCRNYTGPAFANTDGSWQPANADKDTGKITSFFFLTSRLASVYICYRLHLHYLHLNPHAVHQCQASGKCDSITLCWARLPVHILHPPLSNRNIDVIPPFISCGVDLRAPESGGQEVTLSVITVSLQASTFFHSQPSNWGCWKGDCLPFFELILVVSHKWRTPPTVLQVSIWPLGPDEGSFSALRQQHPNSTSNPKGAVFTRKVHELIETI